MRDDAEQLILLNAWEETYKKGQLTLWVLLALKEGSKCVDDVKFFIEEHSSGAMTCELQSLYRNMRKFQHIKIVDFDAGKGFRGPERKYFFLTKLGEQLLQNFIDRNISVFFSPVISKLLKRS